MPVYIYGQDQDCRLASKYDKLSYVITVLIVTGPGLQRGHIMGTDTKVALSLALKECVSERPFNEITIQDLTNKCGISRVAFYYHFKDIYDLLEWSFKRSVQLSYNDQQAYGTWQDVLLPYYRNLLDNKPLIMNIYRNLGRAYMVSILRPTTYDVLVQIIMYAKTGIAKEDYEFIAGFYTHAFVGVILDWIEQGMVLDCQILANKTATTVNGTIYKSLANFEALSH